jgi:hypothetical protein
MYTNTIKFSPVPRIDCADNRSERSQRIEDDPYGFVRVDQIVSEGTDIDSSLASIDAALARYRKRIIGTSTNTFASLQEIFRLK